MPVKESLLNPPLFTVFAQLIEERIGIHYDVRDNAVLSSKLLPRVEESGFASPLDYYYFLRYDDPDRVQFDLLVDELVVNETYFLRELEPLKVVCDEIVKPILDRGRFCRIWSAAASTGEEPLTLAMLLEDRGYLDRCDLVASDISLRALTRARAGNYGHRSMRSMDARSAEKLFVDPTAERTEVKPRLLGAIDWRRVNLTNPEAIEALGRFDVVLCRNVLIYFDEENVQKVAKNVAKALADNGVLLVGASESLLRFGTLFTCEERGGAFLYRRST